MNATHDESQDLVYEHDDQKALKDRDPSMAAIADELDPEYLD